jgi:ABC-type glycerol-3-phosphate transport system substrate-binding protein
LFLAACAQGAAPSAQQPAATAGTKGPVEVRIHDWLQDPDDTFYGPFWKQFEATHPNIKIKREWFPRDDMHTKELALAATGQIGDTVRINVAPLNAELRLKGVIQPLDTFIKQDKAWSDYDHKQLWPGNLATYTSQGQLWGYPVVGHPGAIHHYYNIDMLTKAGAKLPPEDTKQWKQEDAVQMYLTALKTGADGRVSQYGVQPNLGGEGTVAVLRAFGGNYYSDDGTKSMINTPQSVQGLEWLSDLWNKHKVAIPTETNPDYQQTFPGEQVAVVVSTAIAGNITRLVKDKFKWSVAPPPVGPSGKHETQVSSDGVGISKTTKNPNEAWEVIKAYASKEHGVKRHLAGLGSPGSRYDVWTDPEFKQAQPLLSTIIYNALINPQTAPPLRPWSHPANGRYFETDSTLTNILQDVWLGKKSPKAAADDANQAVQAIMDKPPA